MKLFTYSLVITLLASIHSCKKEPDLTTEYIGKSTISLSSQEILTDDVYFTKTELSIEKKNKLDSLLNSSYALLDIPGITVDVITQQGHWNIDTGFVSLESREKVDSTTTFYWASVGKLITSVLIHELINEQKLTLDDKLEKWYPEFQYSNLITVQHLLEHRSGIYSFNYDTARTNALEHPTPNDLLKIALEHDNHFFPGQYWYYSNTGYILLSSIIEKIEHQSYDTVVLNRISNKLHLKKLRALQVGEFPSNIALLHNSSNLVQNDNFNAIAGAGSIISNSKDMNKFLYALFTKKILPQESIQHMTKTLYPMFEEGIYYGQGIMVFDLSSHTNNLDQGKLIGHSGGTSNVKSMAIFSPENQTFISIASNKNIPVEAIAYSILKILRGD